MLLEVTDIFSKKTTQLKLDNDQISEVQKDKLLQNKLFTAPGLVDLQINGYKGIDYNCDTLTIEKILVTLTELLNEGITSILPTLFTNDPAIIESNLALFSRAIEEHQIAQDVILGFHLEGPFISAADGARGAHPSNWIIEPSSELIEKWQRISGNRIKLITLSPTYKGSISFIKKCITMGIKVAIGHTNATSEQILEAIAAGASLSTHLGNAISKTLNRNNNILFDQIANDDLYASIICDGHHLTNTLIKIILRSKPGKVMLVSDATMFAGMQPGIYDSNIGGKIRLDKNKKVSIIADTEYLAGSGSSIKNCLNNLYKDNLLPLSQAWEIASLLPAKYLFDELPIHIKKDTVLFSIQSETIQTILTIKNGSYYFKK